MRNIISAIVGFLFVIATIEAIGLGVIAGNVKNLEERVQEEVQKREDLEAALKVALRKSNVQHKLAYVKLSAKVDKMQANVPPCDLSGFVFKPEGIR